MLSFELTFAGKTCMFKRLRRAYPLAVHACALNRLAPRPQRTPSTDLPHRSAACGTMLPFQRDSAEAGACLGGRMEIGT